MANSEETWLDLGSPLQSENVADVSTDTTATPSQLPYDTVGLESLLVDASQLDSFQLTDSIGKWEPSKEYLENKVNGAEHHGSLENVQVELQGRIRAQLTNFSSMQGFVPLIVGLTAVSIFAMFIVRAIFKFSIRPQEASSTGDPHLVDEESLANRVAALNELEAALLAYNPE